MAWITVERDGARVLFTDRSGGVSAAPFDTANASYASGDDRGCVDENRARAAAVFGIAPAAWVWQRQVHGAEVVTARGVADAGAAADASVTGQDGIALAVLTADCAPVALLGEGAVGAVHAGWRGLAAGVVEAAVDALRAIAPGPVHAIVGACIRPCCYEFGLGDLATVSDRYGPTVAGRTTAGAPALDLAAGVREALARSGVDGVDDSGTCTACGGAHFSHRRHGRTGRQVMLVGRNP